MARDQKLSLSAEDRQKLLKESASLTNQRLRLSCWGILLLADGRPRGEVARECKVHPVTVARWIARFRKLGIAGLLGQRNLQGRRSKLTEVHLQLLRKMALTPPQKLDKPFARWTLERLARYFSAQTGIGIQGNYLGRVLRRLRVSWSRGAESVGRAGLQEVEVLWFTVVKGKRSRLSTSKRDEQKHLLLAAVNLATGHLSSLKVQRRSSSAFVLFLKQLIEEYPKTKVLIIGDRDSVRVTKQLAGFLRSTSEKLAVSIVSMSLRPNERSSDTGESRADVQFFNSSLDVVMTQLLRGVRQIAQVFRS